MRYVLKLHEYEEDDTSWSEGTDDFMGMMETASTIHGMKRSKYDSIRIIVMLPESFLKSHLPNELRELLYDMEDRANIQE